MLHYVHKLAANVVCLPFGARLVAYSRVLERFTRKIWKQRWWEQGEWKKREVVSQKKTQKEEQKDAEMLQRADSGAALDDNYL